jgi:hypothetical protein
VGTLLGYLRHPETLFKVHAALILTNMKLHCKLSRELTLQFRWIMMQAVNLMPEKIES